MKKNINLKYIHILLIIIGIIFVLLPVFHTCLWFDESYSVAIANHSFKEIWVIGGHDVHPILYYWILHVINLILGNNILAYRLFSVLCISILGVLGFTHIRKDFGEKTGILFSFFVFFLPVNLVYAGEIRMYTLAMLLITLAEIYAYRIYKNKNELNIKNWILFAIFSLTSAYTHYYALMTAGIINLFLMIVFIKKSVKEKEFNANLKAFIISGVIQIALYLPWVIYLALQMKQVSAGFWVGLHVPGIFIEIFTFQFVGNLTDTKYIPDVYAEIYGGLILIYIIYLYIKTRKLNEKTKGNKKNSISPAIMAIRLYGLVVVGACLVSLVIRKPIIYARYFLCITNLFIFFLAYTMANKGNKYINIAMCILSVIVAIFINVNLISINYDSSNNEPFDYITAEIQPEDLILYGNEGSGFVVNTKYPNNKAYFWDQRDWHTEEAFKAFGKDMKTIYNLNILENYHGRIWIINATNYAIYDSVKEQYDVKLIQQKSFSTKYKNFQYTISLVEK